MYSSGSSIRQPNPQPLPGEGPNMLPDIADADHIFVDADEYLQSIPPNFTSSIALRNRPPALQPDIHPVQIGQSQSSEHSVAFHQLAQEKRVTASFEFKEPAPQQFGVTLTLGGQRIVEELGPWPSKKAAKEAVCAKGYQVLRDMEGMLVPAPATGENWVGKLQRRCPPLSILHSPDRSTTS
jgi:hypothetical protein